jgi:beta-lactamase regulating signal transducer with metallopeptidase domain
MNAWEVIAAAFGWSIACGALVAAGCALFARAKRLRAGAAHTMWFAALLAVGLLPLAGIASGFVRAQATPAGSGTSVRAPAEAPGTVLVLIPNAPQADGAPQSRGAAPARWLSLIVGIAAAGAAAGIASLILSLVRLSAIKRRSSPLDDPLSRELPWLCEPAGGRETYLRLSFEIETPIAIGFRRPVILIPTDLASENGLRAIESLIIHEHAHLAHYDDYTNLIQRIIERVFWFNPFVWYIGARIALAREMAADDAVLARGRDRTDYAEALWRLAREMRMPSQPIVAPGAIFTRKQIATRIEAILAADREAFETLNVVAVALGAAVAFVAYGSIVVLTPPFRFAAAAATLGGSPLTWVLPPLPATPALPAIPALPGAAAARSLGLPRRTAKEFALRCTSGCDLSGQDFSGADLHGITFSGATLDGTIFRDANLRGASFSGTSADGAIFDGADLSGATFSGVSLDGAKLDGADLTGATFSSCSLSGVSTNNAKMERLNLSGNSFD